MNFSYWNKLTAARAVVSTLSYSSRESLILHLSQKTPILTSTKNYFWTRALPPCEKPSTITACQYAKKKSKKKNPLSVHGRYCAWHTFFYCRLAFINQLKNAREQLVRKGALPCSCDSLLLWIYRTQAPSHNFFPSIWYKHLVVLMSLFQLNWLKLFKYSGVSCLWYIWK